MYIKGSWLPRALLSIRRYLGNSATMFRLRFVFVLLAVLAVSSTSSTEQQHEKCGANEKFVSCGTACPLTCSKPHPQTCTKNCVIGCQCKQGFLRNSTGACVTPPKCQRS